MTNYVWRARDKSGQEVVREAPAETAKESRELLLQDGLTDLTLLEGDVGAATSAQFPKDRKVLGQPVIVTSEDRAKQHRKPPMTFGRAVWETISQAKGLLLAILAIGFLEGLRGHAANAEMIVGAEVVLLAVLMCFRLPSIYFTKLVQAADWSQWDQVLRYIGVLTFLGRCVPVSIPKSALARYRAQALAGSSRLSEALSGWQVYRGQAQFPDWLHDATIAGLYDIAKQHDKGLEYSLKSVAGKRRPESLIDLANRYLRYKRDAASARTVILEVENEPLTEAAQPFLHRCKGILSYLEGDFVNAQEELEECLTQIGKAVRVMYRDGQESIAKAYLACALAKQGKRDQARRVFSEAREYLVATGEKDLLAECEAVVVSGH